jgi:hypothetical protein
VIDSAAYRLLLYTPYHSIQYCVWSAGAWFLIRVGGGGCVADFVEFVDSMIELLAERYLELGLALIQLGYDKLK